MALVGKWVLGIVAVVLSAHALWAEEPARHARDAAEEVKEGDVAQWLKYYQQERGFEPQAPPNEARPEGSDGGAGSADAATGGEAGEKR